MSENRKCSGPVSPRRWGKRVLFSTVLAGLVMGGLEMTARHFLLRYRDRFPFVSSRPYLLGSVIPEVMRRVFDAELGGDLHFPDTPYGERPRARDYGRVATMIMCHYGMVGDTPLQLSSVAETLP